VRVYAVVSSCVQGVIEVFSTCEEAEEFIEEVRYDDPKLAAMLGVEALSV
jgi:hypothetical protein